MDAQLQANLAKIDRSLLFVGVLLGATLLSWRGLTAQRQELLTGNSGTDVSALQLSSSVLVVLALGYFFCLALQAGQEQNDRSTRVNLWASLLVLLAALLRLWDRLSKEI